MSIVRYSNPLLANWSALNRLDSLSGELHRLFDFGSPVLTGWTPALDLFEENDAFVVQLEVPGLKPEDVHLELKEGVLTVSGERKATSTSESGKAFRSERHYGKFQRSVTLPTVVDSQQVKAAYKDGILTVTLPKAEEAKPRKIEVSVS